jgi:hypothetical protein
MQIQRRCNRTGRAQHAQQVQRVRSPLMFTVEPSHLSEGADLCSEAVFLQLCVSRGY